MLEYLKFDFKISIFLTITFIVMTVVGTLTHELGHIAVSKFLGYNASINYKSSSYWRDNENIFLIETNRQYQNEIKNRSDFPNKEKYFRIVDKYQKDTYWILLGGPLQTILTGTIGLLLLLIYRKKLFSSDKVHYMGWVIVFLSLFWLRQLANLGIAVVGFIFKGNISLKGDEMRLAHYLGFHIWSIQIITGMMALAVLWLVLNRLPKKIILSFMISGLVGGALGYYLWLIKFGPYLMP